MMTKEQMLKILADMGLKKTYRPYYDDESPDVICLKTRKSPKVIDGIMHGSEIDLYNKTAFRVWTSQKNKAMKVARDNNFNIRCMDGECEIFIPVDRADEFLHSFGAKVKGNRKSNPKAIEALKQYRAKHKRREPTWEELKQGMDKFSKGMADVFKKSNS